MGQVSTKIVVIDKASAKLNNIYKAITRVDDGFRKLSANSNSFRISVDRAASSAKGMSNTINNVSTRFTKMNNQGTNLMNTFTNVTRRANGLNTTLVRLSSTNSGVQRVSRSVSSIGNSAKNSSKHTNGLISKLKMLASTYLGVMGAQAMLQTSDTLTSANNKFTTLGTMEYGMDEATAQKFSTETQDKIFNAAQSAAASYTGMMTNVAKSVTLAGDAFGETSDQQIDNAIKFQEIMAKSYALGGASAAEQASSMYQMVQALGSGVLQGDELRSVREGAPLAYQAIEEFAQGVLNSEESLKDLASQGLITSDLVVASILDMEDETNKAFEKIDLTWGQLWTKFKNDATKAFEPFLIQLRKLANSPSFQLLTQKVIGLLNIIGRLLTGITVAIGNALDWVAKNWSMLQPILNALLAVLIALATYALVNFIDGIVKSIVAFATAHTTLLLFLGLLAVLVWYFSVVGVSAETLGVVLINLGLAGLLAGIMMGNVFLIVIAIIVILIGIFLAFTEEVVGGTYVVLAVFNNLFGGIWNAGVIAFEALLNLITGVVNFLGSVFFSPVESVMYLFKDLGVFCLDTLGAIAKGIDTIFGSNFYSTVQGWKNDLIKWTEDNFKKPDQLLEYVNLDDMLVEHWDYGDAYNEGAAVGKQIKDSINNGINNGINSITDALSGVTNDIIDKVSPDNLALSDTSGLLDNIGKDVGDIDKNTGSMAKSMELTEEDLKYLRQIAEMEAINKFTTAEIKVEMTNNNTMNNMNDLDGIVTHLSTVLKEELEVVADGVHSA